MNKMVISIYLPIITLNINRLNTPIKKHKMIGLKKPKTFICCVQETHLRPKDAKDQK